MLDQIHELRMQLLLLPPEEKEEKNTAVGEGNRDSVADASTMDVETSA